MIQYDGIFHPIWNGIADLVWLLYVVTVIRTPSTRLPRGWKSKLFWIVVGSIGTAYGFGLYLPFGVLLAWPTFVKRYRRQRSEQEGIQARPSHHHGYSFYPEGRPIAPR